MGTNKDSLSLGEFLRQEREQRGVAIEQVASATKIAVRLLHALEADQYAELPARPFVRGFVASYVRFLGLDPSEVLTRFTLFIEKKTDERPTREIGHSGYGFERKEGEQGRLVLTLVMLGFVVFVGVVIYFLKPSLRPHRSPQIEKLKIARPTLSVQSSLTRGVFPTPSESSPVQPVSTPTPVHSRTASITPSLSDPLNSGRDLPSAEVKQKVVFKALESIWIRYQVDQKPSIEFVFKKDKLLVLKARERIQIQVSHPELILYSANGLAYRKVSESPSVVLRQNDPTLFFPLELTEKMGDPFPGQKPLQGRKSPTFRLSVETQ